MAEIKFCGLTRVEDARMAASLGAAYVGAVFAGSPRMLTEQQAEAVFAAVPSSIGRVGVFGAEAPATIADRANRLGLDVVQLHGDPDVRSVEQLRLRWKKVVWAVQRVGGAVLPEHVALLSNAADALVLDARTEGMLGGTGVALPWRELRAGVEALRRSGAKLVLAGGLRPENVADAIELLSPDVVDVSSGVEREAGVKDHGRMRAFADAVHMAGAR